MDKIQAVAAHIAGMKKDGDGIVVVTGAMGNTADHVLAMAAQAGQQISAAEKNTLLAAAGQQTAALLAIALQNQGVDAQSAVGFQSELVNNQYHSNARVDAINTEDVEAIIENGKVAVVAGFQSFEEATGHDGSSVTAVGIAAQLGWDCEIYADTDGLYTVDQDIYPQAKQIKAITYEEMMEIAHLGSAKIGTKAVELAKKYNVKLFLGKSLEQDKSKGTYIVSKEMIVNENLMVEDTPVTGMGIQDEIAIFTLRNVPADGKAVAECFRILGELNINVDMISQQMAEDGTCSVSFSCNAEQGAALQKELEAQEAFEGITVGTEGSLAMVSLVGVGMATHSGVASKVFQILAENGIKYYHITTSEISISVTVEMDQKMKAAIALCRAFNL